MQITECIGRGYLIIYRRFCANTTGGLRGKWEGSNPRPPNARGLAPDYIRPTQPFILSGSINRVPALIGWGKGEDVTPAG